MVAIIVAFMFVSFILTDFGVQKYRAWQAVRATRPAPAAVAAGLPMWWQLPEGVKLSSAHNWFRSDSAGGMEVGADAFLTHAVGEVRQVVLPRPGDQVTAGQPLFRLVRNGRSLTVPSALTGTVTAANSRLRDDPSLLSSDPYGGGWICRIIQIAAPSDVRFGAQARQWLDSEFSRLREFLSAQVSPEFALGMTSQDGGIPTAGCLAELDKAAWSDFEAEFLKK